MNNEVIILDDDDCENQSPIIIESSSNDVIELESLGPPGPVGPTGIGEITSVDGSLISFAVGTIADVKINPAHSNTWTAPQVFDLITAQNFVGSFSGSFVGDLTGNVLGNVSGSAASFTTNLGGEVIGTQTNTVLLNSAVISKFLTGFNYAPGVVTDTDSILSAIGKLAANIDTKQASGLYLTGLSDDVSASGPGIATAVVNRVGGSSALSIHNAEVLANAATSSNTIGALVKRNSNGDFSAHMITSDLTGNVLGNVSGSAASFTSALSGDVTGPQGTTAIASTVVTGKTLTNFISNPGTLAASDSILSAIGKLDGNVKSISNSVGAASGIAPLDANSKVPASFLPAAALGALKYKGTYDASIGTYPANPTMGDYYVISVAGSIASTNYKIGDWATYDGTNWDKIDNSQNISTVNGKTGTVVLTTSDISEGSSLYFTNARTIGALLTGYAQTTGTISASDSVLSAIQKLSGNQAAMVSGVSSVYGRIGAVTAQSGDYSTSLVPEGTRLYFTNARSIGALLTGYAAAAGTVSATDSTLSAIQKIDGNVNALVTGVSSVNGRTGAVTAQSGDYNTGQVTETTNLYFTNARSIAAALTGYTSGPGVVTASDSVLTAIQKLNGNQMAAVGGVSSVFGRTGAVTAQSGDYSTTLVTEGANLYYTAARFNSAFAAKTTGDLSEGTNLYYTAARFNSAFAAKTTSDLAEGTNLYFSNSRAIGSVLTGFTSGAGTVSATDSVLSALQKLDGNIAGKQPAGNYQPAGSYQAAGNYLTALTGDVVASGPSSSAATIQPGAVTNGKLAQMAAHTYKGNNTGATAYAVDVTSAQLTADLNLFTAALQGLVPASGGGTTNFLRADGQWAVVTSGFQNPMTTLGDLIYGGTSGAATRLAGDTSNTKKFLTSQSSSGAATAPFYSTIAVGDVPTLNQNTTGTAANVTGVVAIANGGTGTTTAITAFNRLSPLTNVGDTLYLNASAQNVALSIGLVGQFLTPTNVGGAIIPQWASFGAQSVQNFSGDDATTVFTLSQSVASPSVIDVFIYGVYQNKSTYTASGTTLTFSTPPPAGTLNIEVEYTPTIPTAVATPTAGDVEVTDATKGIILKSPNGTRWRFTVSNAGALTGTSL